MRSVVVVFPASMCAMMPIFLHRSNGTVLDTAFFLSSLRDSCSPTMFAGLLKIHLNYACGAPGVHARPSKTQLPPIMRKSLIRFRHPVYIFFLLDGRAFTVRSVEQFIAQLVNHSLFRAPAGVSHQPTNRQPRAPVR